MTEKSQKSEESPDWGKYALGGTLAIMLLSGLTGGILVGTWLTGRAPAAQGNAPVKAEAAVVEPHCHYGTLATFLAMQPANLNFAIPNMPRITVRDMGDPDPLVRGRIDVFFVDVRNMRIDMVNGASFSWEKGVTKVCILPAAVLTDPVTEKMLPRPVIVFEAWTDVHNN